MRRVVIFLMLCISWQASFAMEKIFYTLRGENVGDYQQVSSWIKTLKAHPHSIDIIISQAYQLDQTGTVWGEVDPRLYNYAQHHHIKFMALLTNANFDSTVANEFLNDPAAEQRAIDSLVTLCEKQKLYGIQVDFEGMPLKDRQQFTNFYQNLAKALHENNLKISAAVYPFANNIPPTTILKRLYDLQSGAYDYQALGTASDFISIMTYDQHIGATTPGPIAGVPWDKKVIAYALRYIPADKISLGIPVYSGYWKTSVRNGYGSAFGTGIDYQTMHGLLKKYHAQLHWDDQQQVPYTFYNVDQFNEYIFAEDAQSFADKLALVKTYHLRGFSVWRLGMEDPAIWQEITATAVAHSPKINLVHSHQHIHHRAVKMHNR